MERKEIEQRLECFVKKGDFETAAKFAEEFGHLDLAIDYIEKSKQFENKNKKEVYYQEKSANKNLLTDLLKDIVYFNTSRPGEVPQNFPYKNYHFLEQSLNDLKKN